MTSSQQGDAPLTGLACLVLAHDNEPQLRSLLRAMAASGAHCFVHVDRRADALRRALEADPPAAATLLPATESLRIHWGGFRMVEATLRLLRIAIADPATQHVCLLSAAHLPIRSPAAIADFLFDGREHLELRLCAAEPMTQMSLRRFWFLGLPGREEANALVRFVNRNSWRLGRRDLVRGLRGLTPMAGSQWWHMTAPCARHVLAFIDANPWYTRFFRQVRIPDESFFHTLIGASPYGTRLGEPCSWQVMTGSGYSAQVIDWDELRLAQSSGRPFARKFDAAARPAVAAAALTRATSPGRTSGGAQSVDDVTIIRMTAADSQSGPLPATQSQ